MTALVVFARAPVAGRTKTRLGASVGVEVAAALAEAFLEDTLATAAGVAAGLRSSSGGPAPPPALHVAGEPEHPALARLCARFGAARARQIEGDLGARMAAALAQGVAACGAAVVVGSDAPTLPAATLRDAAALLAAAAADVVLAPSHDGGYVLVGSRVAPPPALFQGARWSTEHALADTLRGAARAGLRARLLPPWYDVDTLDDLRVLAAHLAVAPHAAPATAAALGRLRASAAGAAPF